MKQRILVIEDEKSIADAIVYAMKREGFMAEAAYDGEEALKKFNLFKPDAMILDIMLPGINGFEVLRRLDSRNSVGIIMLTAKEDIVDKVLGLELGADDYITKPFDMRELLARLRSLLRRLQVKVGSQVQTEIQLDGLILNLQQRKAVVGDKLLDLTPKTVVLAKENPELGKMSLLENAEYYPRSIYLYHLDSKEYETVKAPKDMFLGGAILSPDKKHLLYYEYSIGDTAHYLMSMEEREPSQVTNNILGIALTAEWDDANNVIGASYAGGAYIADTNRNITQVADLQEQIFTVQKTQDKIYYITIGDSMQLFMLDRITNEKKNLNVDNADDIIPSPDGKQILISKWEGSKKKLLVADDEGNILRTIAEETEVTGASWSPDQLMIAYQLKTVINGVDSSGLYLYDVLTGKSMQIAVNIGNAKIRWSPSGEKIAVAELDERNYNSSIIYLKRNTAETDETNATVKDNVVVMVSEQYTP